VPLLLKEPDSGFKHTQVKSPVLTEVSKSVRAYNALQGQVVSAAVNCWLMTQTEKSKTTKKEAHYDPNQCCIARQQAGT
jgi:hypothetical protein